MIEEKTLILDADKCTGCRVCELVCSMAQHHEYNPAKSYIRIISNRETNVNIATLDTRCDFCNKCVENCLSQAIMFTSLEEAVILRKQNRIGIFPAPLVGRK